MTKNAELNDDLLADALVDVVDDIRREVHGALGTRPWVVDIITRRWSGDVRGVGDHTLTVLRLDPTPMVVRSAHDRFAPGGREGDGTVTLTGVSLRYTEAELAPKADERTEIAYRIREGHGTRMKDSWYVLSTAPVPRRGDKSGDSSDWRVSLIETSAMGDFDGVDAP